VKEEQESEGLEGEEQETQELVKEEQESEGLEVEEQETQELVKEEQESEGLEDLDFSNSYSHPMSNSIIKPEMDIRSNSNCLSETELLKMRTPINFSDKMPSNFQNITKLNPATQERIGVKPVDKGRLMQR
jgi:hypothetical protein